MNYVYVFLYKQRERRSLLMNDFLICVPWAGVSRNDIYNDIYNSIPYDSEGTNSSEIGCTSLPVSIVCLRFYYTTLFNDWQLCGVP